MANGTDQTAARIDALGGGAPLPQAATDAIARRLLGPDLARRYGDVIGTRPTSMHDVARDFAVGVISKDPLKADTLKSQVLQSYRDEFRKEEAAARARDEANRAKLNSFFEGLASVKAAPKEAQSALLKHVLTVTTGGDVDPTVIKLFLADENKGLNALLSTPEIYETARDKPEDALAQIASVTNDPVKAQQVLSGLQKMQRDHAETQKTINEGKRIAKLTDRSDPSTVARDRFISKMAGKTVRDRLGRQRVLSPDEIETMADRFFPKGAVTAAGPAAPPAPVGLPQAPAPAAAAPDPSIMGPASSATTTPTTGALAASVTPTTGEPVGLPQAAAPAPAPASPAPTKVRRITGTVSRVE